MLRGVWVWGLGGITEMLARAQLFNRSIQFIKKFAFCCHLNLIV